MCNPLTIRFMGDLYKFLKSKPGAAKWCPNTALESSKGYDPNTCFSGITFFSGLSLWRLQIEKWTLMWCLFFDADFWKFSHFRRSARFWLPFQNLNSVVLSESPHLNYKYLFMQLPANFLSECINFDTLCTFHNWCYLDQHSNHGNTKHTSPAS